MRFDRTCDLLQQQVAHYHRTVSRLYQEFGEQELPPRNRLMLDYLIDHELRMALAIQDFMNSSPPGAHENWLRNISIPFPAPGCEPLTDGCRSDLDQLVGAALGYKNALIAFFRHLLENCVDEETTRLFLALKTQEENGMKRFIRHAQGLEDL